LAMLPQVTPLPSTQISLAGLGPLPVEKKLRTTEIVLSEGLLHEVHIRGVSLVSGGKFASAGSQLAFLGALPLPQDSCQPSGQRDVQGCDKPCQRRFAPAPAPDFFRAANGAGVNRFGAQKT